MNTLLLVMLGLLLLFLIVVSYAIASFGITAFFGAPFVATKQKMTRKALQKAGVKEGESITDIGCGDGSVLCAARDVGASRLVGYELNPILATIARLRLRGSDAFIKRGNMFRQDLEETDIVFLYLFPKAVDRLRGPLSQLPGKTRILSRGFPFTGVVPLKSFIVDGSHFYLYRSVDL